MLFKALFLWCVYFLCFNLNVWRCGTVAVSCLCYWPSLCAFPPQREQTQTQQTPPPSAPPPLRLERKSERALINEKERVNMLLPLIPPSIHPSLCRWSFPSSNLPPPPSCHVTTCQILVLTENMAVCRWKRFFPHCCRLKGSVYFLLHASWG